MVAKGFKNTEIGVIPEDWEAVRIEDIAEVDCENLSSSTNPNLEIKYISLECINEGSLTKFDELQFKDAPSRARRILRKGDILVSTVRPNLKSHYFFNYNSKDFICSTGFSVIRTTQCSNYIYHHFFGEQINRQIENLIVGSNYPAINNKDVKNLQIPLPPLPEQKAIAEALSDADAWIVNLEQLIAKKRLIKQGAMQELLRPKEDWEVKKLGEVATFRRGSFPQPYGLDKWYDDLNGKPFVQVYDVSKNRKLKDATKWRISELAQMMSVFAKKGTVILTIQGSIGRIAITQYDAYVDRTLLIFESFKVELDKFFFMLVVEQLFEIEKEKAPGGIIKTITKDVLAEFEISFPKSLDEQTRIATILSDMDTEIESLEKQLAKARQIKQGMMQELLTGRVRLV